MKLFKTQDNQIFAYELDGSQEHLIGDKTPITQKEADVIYKENQSNLLLEPTPAEKLASVGLTVDDLKALLGVK